MSRVLLAALTLTQIDLEPDQAPFDHHEVILSKDGVAGDPVETTDDHVEFDDLEPGTYTCTAVSLDRDGKPMAPVQTSDPVVIEPDATANVVTSIVLQLQPAPAPAPAPAAP